MTVEELVAMNECPVCHGPFGVYSTRVIESEGVRVRYHGCKDSCGYVPPITKTTVPLEHAPRRFRRMNLRRPF